jgi:hypothetical protein
MKKDITYQLLPRINSQNCFGCHPDNPVGLKMNFYEKENEIYSWLTVPGNLCGWNQMVHGGIISTILDEMMSRCAMFASDKISFTKSITIDYIRPIPTGAEIVSIARVSERVKKRELKIESQIFFEGKKCAAGSGLFVTYTLEQIEKLGIGRNAVEHKA